MLHPLDGPSAQDIIPVDTITVKEVKIGATALEERKVVTLQPDGKIKVYFGDGVSTPNATTVSTKGFVHFKNSIRSYEATNSQKIYIIADSGTVNVVTAERA